MRETATSVHRASAAIGSVDLLAQMNFSESQLSCSVILHAEEELADEIDARSENFS